MSASIPPETVQDRLDRLKELTEFTEKCKKQLNEIFETLGWSQEYDDEFNKEPMEQCPYDPNHRVPVRTMEKHKASCRLSKMGYPVEEQKEMYDPSVCYENSNVKSFLMDKSTQHQVILQARSAAPLMKMEGVFWQGQYSGQPVDVPQNHKRAVCDLTVADRLALYDHVVGVLGQQNEAAASNDDLYVDLVSKLQKDEGQNEPKSHLELMAEMRDYKRRRQSYRAKNVHITKKSYTEVIREVISVHSEELARQWKEDEDEKQLSRSDQSPQGRWLERRRSKSAESHHSHSKRHRSRERSHERDRERSREPGRERDREPGRERSREPGRERDRERSREPGREPGRERDREPGRERSREPGRERSREPGHERDRERSREPGRERDREPGRERSREPGRERDRERSREPGHERSREPGRERSRERRDNRERKKKKRKERDSRSPDGRHHNRKKKKKEDKERDK